MIQAKKFILKNSYLKQEKVYKADIIGYVFDFETLPILIPLHQLQNL